MTELNVHEALRNARAILAERGLAKGQLVDKGGSVCARGALFAAITGSPTKAPPLRLLLPCEEALGFSGAVHPAGLTRFASVWPDSDLPDWNNQEERTLEEVLDRFDLAIWMTAPEPPTSRVGYSADDCAAELHGPTRSGGVARLRDCVGASG